MSAYEATFLALAAAWLLGSGEQATERLLPGLLPFLAWLATLALPGHLALPLAGLAACLLPRRAVAAGLLLAAATYSGPAEALRTALAWWALAHLTWAMGPRLDALPEHLRGAPARLFTTGVLYFALLPLESL